MRKSPNRLFFTTGTVIEQNCRPAYMLQSVKKKLYLVNVKDGDCQKKKYTFKMSNFHAFKVLFDSLNLKV